MIRVGVVGAAGRMGQQACRAIAADAELQLAAAVDPSHAGSLVEGIELAEDMEALAAAGVEVAVEFTGGAAALGNIAWCIGHKIHVVSGTTGFEPDPAWADQRDVGVFIAPNFAIGAVLMQRFAAKAVRYLPDAEIIELHHQDKPDAPSGTAMATARRMAAARGRTGPSGARNGCRARGAPTWTASTCTPFGSPAWWRTRRSSWEARDRRSGSATTPATGPRSCPAC